MKQIFIASFNEMIRSRWIFIYALFFALLSSGFLLISPDVSKLAITLNNVVLILTPLIGMLFGVSYFYQYRDFLVLLICQPISRWQAIIGMYGGLAIALCASIIVGLLVPLVLFGSIFQEGSSIFLSIIFIACVLSVIFSLISFLIALKFDNKVQGLGLAIFLWLFFAVLYDGLLLILMFLFKDYPLDRFAIFSTMFNPIDLSRIFILLKLNISAMMGYTGAVLSKFLGNTWGIVFIVISLALWLIIPAIILKRESKKKDF